MKVVILAGGYGTRISEESNIRPKPMVEIGGRPILWHIMKIYGSYGLNDFVICCGYKGEMIREYFINYKQHVSDIRINLQSGELEVLQNNSEPWNVTLIDTGLNTMTGGRLRRIKDQVSDGTFCMSYGDGVGRVDIPELIEFHRSHNKLVTLTAVQPPGRYGAFHFESDDSTIHSFKEKPTPTSESGWVNGGYMVMEPAALDYVEGDSTVWELEPLENLARDGQLVAYRHAGYWQSMDTLRDRMVLEKEWESGDPAWKVW